MQLSSLELNFTFLPVKIHHNSTVHHSSFLTILLLCHPSYLLPNFISSPHLKKMLFLCFRHWNKCWPGKGKGQRFNNRPRIFWASQVVTAVKNLPTSAGDSRHGFGHWVGKTPWRRKWQLIPVLLSGKFHGQRSLAGYSLCESTKSWTWLSDWAHTHIQGYFTQISC